MKRHFPPTILSAMEAAALLARWTLGGFFIYMGLQKALDPVEFLKLLRQYDIVQSSLALNAMATTLPWFEVFCGLLLVVGIAVRGTALLVAGLLVVFTGVVVRRALGLESALAIPFCAVKFDCGCGGGPEYICAKLRENTGLILLAAVVLAGRGRAFCAFYTLPGSAGDLKIADIRPNSTKLD